MHLPDNAPDQGLFLADGMDEGLQFWREVCLAESCAMTRAPGADCGSCPGWVTNADVVYPYLLNTFLFWMFLVTLSDSLRCSVIFIA